MNLRIAPHTAVLRLLFAVLLGSALLVGAGCSSRGEAVGPVSTPAPANLSAPVPAVRSYLDWVSLGYRLANSEAATSTHTEYEGVRIDSYIELNRQKGRGIDQRLESFEVRGSSEEGTHAVLAASERWAYRYFSLDTLRYVSPEYEASYETTYALTKTEKGWLVDKIDAKALAPVK